MGFPLGSGFLEVGRQQNLQALGQVLGQRRPTQTGGVPFLGGAQGITVGGGGGGGGGGAASLPPAYWENLGKAHELEQGFRLQQEELARRGFGLSEQEVQQRKENLQKMLGLLQQRTMEQELPTALRTIGNEAAARGSFMSQARILGQQEARTAAHQRMKEARTEAQGQISLYQIGLQQERLRLDEELARLGTQRQIAELDYQNVLLQRR